MSDQAEWMADLHAECFTVPRPWNADEFAGLLDDPHTICIPAADGFLLARAVGDEAELLTICVRTAARRHGIGHALLGEFIAAAAAAGVDHCVLEVGADNTAAMALYRSFGFVESGRRPGYYSSPGGTRSDALILSRSLTAS